jgi:sterol desaturase/sphingolipid hydroxylase (fatty acid hydroxylase superfamily)
MKHLTFEEINTLTEIPKFLKDPYSVKIAKDGQVTPKGWAGIETEYMLESNLYFGSYMAVALGFLFYNYTLIDILKNFYFTIFGYIIWCFLEYIVHRYKLHHNMLKTRKINGGDMHHIFPNHPGALSIGDVNPYLPILLSPLYFIITPVQLTLIFVGVISGLLFYNIIHYNCHLGPEVNIGWFRALRTHHMKHHFRDQNSRFGISATIMDHIFGTFTPKEKSK